MITQIEPWIDDAELVELRRVIESTFVVEDTLTREFEDRIMALTGAKHALAMCNGTMALFCCLKAAGIGADDEVIVPDMTFIATANAVLMAGATPVFCDVDHGTLCFDIASARKAITPKAKAIMPVHLYGQACDMDQIIPFAREHGLIVIEDAAQGIGVRFTGQHVGTFGEMGVLSFYGNKTITCGEGGIVLTNDGKLAQACYRLKNHGRDKKGVFVHEAVGYNFSFTEMQAAIGVSQMKKLDRILARKQAIYERYKAELSDIQEIGWPFVDQRTQPVWWFTSIFVDDATKMGAYMREKQIQTRRFFYPLHKQPCYQDIGLAGRTYPESAWSYEHGISLPSSYSLTAADQGTVIATIRAYFGR
jgi:perosamine synthetase